jgi:murein DD-endopeptidase MepM/ murein hydrolase activator NlpD
VAFLGRLDIFAHASPGSRIHAFAEDSKLSALVVDTPTIRLHAIRVDAPDGKSRWYDELGRRSDTGVFLGRPLALSRITSRYGTRLHPITGDVRTHRGIDYGAATGTPVVAIADGTVTTRATDASSGNWLKLDHTGRQSFYLHLDDFAEGIAQGAKVQQGQVIGFVGSTGKSTGPHLHFETRMGPVSIDPLQMLPAPTEVLTQHERPAFLARLRRLQEATPSRR